MPEGDTVWLTAHRLHQALAGRELTMCDLRVPAHATADLRGRTVREVVARGKHILIRTSPDLTLHTHLRMDGSWRIGPPGRRPPGLPEHMMRVLLGNAEWWAAGYRVHDVVLVRSADESQLVGHLGPDLLGPDWDTAEAIRRLRQDPGREIGLALLDQRNLAGIGNMYKAEALFIERVNPWMPVADVDDLDRLVGTASRLLRMNRNHPEQSTTGLVGRGREHWVYERAGQPCRRCRTLISRADQGAPPYQRGTYWCASCQPA
jgi:endonuclease VIII